MSTTEKFGFLAEDAFGESAFGQSRRMNAAAKRAFDLLVACAALLLLAPLMCLICIAIKIDSRGPVLFRQTRHGLNGRPFRIYKFRTMSVLESGSHVKQATANDPRVTRLGRILRKTSIDEFPQFLNVILGDMSIVGPRPHAACHDEHFSRLIPIYPQRFVVKPGITGWAQVNGARGETPRTDDMRRRIELDLWYIENWTLLLDFRIIFTTILHEFLRSQHAH